MKQTFFSAAAVAVLLSFGAAPASATILTFEGDICGPTGTSGCTNGSQISSTYGSGGGASVIYDANANAVGSPDRLFWWADSYSTLTSVAYGENGGTPEIFLKPDAGFSLTLASFDIGSWPNFSRNSQVTVLDGLGNTLFSTGAILIPGGAPTTYNNGGLGWTSTSGIRIQWGPDGYDVGIDNVSFSVTQVTSGIPEPATWAMMLIGFAGLGFAARRRRAV